MAADATALLQELADATRLREGPGGVRRVLFELLRTVESPVPIKQLAVRVRLPIPVLSALRREMESRRLLVRSAGTSASGEGRDLLMALFGVSSLRPLPPADSPCPEDLIPTLKSWSARRPELDARLDQTRATAETAWRRALYLLHAGAALGQRMAFLGDDDLAALTMLLAVRSLFGDAAVARMSCTVFEIDERYQRFMTEVAALEGLPIEVRGHDLRAPLPVERTGCFDTFVTDPPYTFPGAVCFLSRGVEALDPAFGGIGILSYGPKGTQELADVQHWLTGHGIALRDIQPAFNTYEGASILASSSDLYRLDIPARIRLDESGRIFDGPLYTADKRTQQRVYRCRDCGEQTPVGPDETLDGIAALRNAGCPKCGGGRFRLFG